jgi:caa(3)-type oxidase subunit IV
MNNPPEIAQDPSEHEEYAHNVQKHVRGYLIVGATLLVFTMITVALSYVDFGAILSSLFHTNLSSTQGHKANIAVAVLVAAFKAGLVGAIFMHLAAEKRLIYRILVFTGFFVLGLFWLTLLAWYDYPIFR